MAEAYGVANWFDLNGNASILGMRNCTYTMGHGVSPGCISLSCVPQPNPPATRGYVRLYAVSMQQGGKLTLIGNYGPNETLPQYKRIRVSSSRNWVRLM